jgi:sortase A
VLTRAIRTTGWTLVSVGVLILLYLVYLLFFTNIETEQAQRDLLEEWSLQVGDVTLPAEDLDPEAVTAEAEPVDPGDAYAVIWFERPGSDVRPVRQEPRYVVEGVSLEVLKRGPGHYPETAPPGGAGNFAISGHRTTYGAPFYDLDDLQPGDRVHVVDRQGREFVYEVREQRVVSPFDVWVIGRDPLGEGGPLMTITTCHPRLSAAQRLIVFADLVTA